MAEVTFRSIHKRYGDVEVVSDLDLTLPDGTLTVLVGPSGCGKTTTLRMLAGLESVTAGSIHIGPRDVTTLDPSKRDIAMVFQNYALYSHLTVRENIMFPLRAKGMGKAEAVPRARMVEDLLGLTPLVERKPSALSGGQQQRVAIARALVREPSVFLFDEPLSNLDAQLRVDMRTEILRIQREVGTTSLYVTHDQEEAMTLADTVVVMDRGRIGQQGTPQEVYSTPANVFTASFVGSPRMNLMEGTVSDQVFLASDSGLRIPLPRVTGSVTLGIRPESMDVMAASEIPEGDSASSSWSSELRIVLMENLGPRVLLQLETANRKALLRAVVPADRMRDLTEGVPVRVRPQPGQVHLFDPVSGRRFDGE